MSTSIEKPVMIVLIKYTKQITPIKIVSLLKGTVLQVNIPITERIIPIKICTIG
ncbi:hypothetical protein RH915_04670 [Serpentinicella sp. ANB-PHB4]|uniref:hypothetical protein n=1 Tax=Serpentinicella sp. ANB-PHB4 TaxID=3074076 RepID=UPI0028546C77|nr:hypothetical protein [Serpentinicella sp. ANB-PHB4]MDR5658777.1 hypothetical protein [Serpentinicella sp. ANB-PHB4]